MADTCYKELDIDGDVIMKDDDEPSVPLGKVGLNIINNFFSQFFVVLWRTKKKERSSLVSLLFAVYMSITAI